MAVFTSRHERRLWTWVGVVVAAIYSTLGLANSLAGSLDQPDLVELLWIAGLVVMASVVGILVIRSGSGAPGLVVLVGIVSAYFMVFVRMASPFERSHLFEYGLVGVLIYLALVERRDNGSRVPVPALIAIGATAVMGLVDEVIQWVIPERVYDIRDVGFNALAGFMAVGAAASINWASRRRQGPIASD